MIDVYRLGSMRGEVRVKFRTEDISAKAGVGYASVVPNGVPGMWERSEQCCDVPNVPHVQHIPNTCSERPTFYNKKCVK